MANGLLQPCAHQPAASKRDKRVIAKVSRLKQTANDLSYVDDTYYAAGVFGQYQKTIPIPFPQCLRILLELLQVGGR
jgi:hypothetical protein